MTMNRSPSPSSYLIVLLLSFYFAFSHFNVIFASELKASEQDPILAANSSNQKASFDAGICSEFTHDSSAIILTIEDTRDRSQTLSAEGTNPLDLLSLQTAVQESVLGAQKPIEAKHGHELRPLNGLETAILNNQLGAANCHFFQGQEIFHREVANILAGYLLNAPDSETFHNWGTFAGVCAHGSNHITRMYARRENSTPHQIKHFNELSLDAFAGAHRLIMAIKLRLDFTIIAIIYKRTVEFAQTQSQEHVDQLEIVIENFVSRFADKAYIRQLRNYLGF